MKALQCVNLRQAEFVSGPGKLLEQEVGHCIIPFVQGRQCFMIGNIIRTRFTMMNAGHHER